MHQKSSCQTTSPFLLHRSFAGGNEGTSTPRAEQAVQAMCSHCMAGGGLELADILVPKFTTPNDSTGVVLKGSAGAVHGASCMESEGTSVSLLVGKLLHRHGFNQTSVWHTYASLISLFAAGKLD